MVLKVNASIKKAGDISLEMASLLDFMLIAARLLDRLSPSERLALFLAHRCQVLEGTLKELKHKGESDG